MNASKDDADVGRAWPQTVLALLFVGCTASHERAVDAGLRDVSDGGPPATDTGVVAHDSGRMPDPADAATDAATPFDPYDCSGGESGSAYAFAGEPADFITLAGSFGGDASDGWSVTPISDSWVQVDVVQRPEGQWWWTFQFRSPDDAVPLTPGTYLDAQATYDREVGRPGISIAGTGRGCNPRGTFTIYEIELDGVALRGLRARYEQHCEGAEPRLVGCIRYEAR